MVDDDAPLLDDDFDGVPTETVAEVVPGREVEDQDVRLLPGFEAANVALGRGETVVMARQGDRERHGLNPVVRIEVRADRHGHARGNESTTVRERQVGRKG
jgi:hypothetical protein